MPKPTGNCKTPTAVRLLCLLMAGLTACSTTRPEHAWRDMSTQFGAKTVQMVDSWGEPPADQNPQDPQIAPGFLLSVHSLADSKLNGDYRVEFNGDLQLPYDVSVNTTGMTLSDLKKKLTEVYRPYFKTPSDIDLHLKERRYWIDIRGLVEKPGRYLVEPEASLDLAIGMAGGLNKDTPPLYVRIQKGSKMFIFDLSQYYSRGVEDRQQILGWLGGEVVFFQRELGGLPAERSATGSYRQPIFFMGEVRKPGEYLLSPGGDYLDSLKQAGGFTEKADLDNIEIIRRNGRHKQVFDLTWEEFQRAPAPAQGDIVFVHADNITKFERHTSLFATLIGTMAAVVTSVILVLAYNKGRI